MVSALAQLPENVLRRFGGGLGRQELWSTMLRRSDWLSKKGRICLLYMLSTKSAVYLKKRW